MKKIMRYYAILSLLFLLSPALAMADCTATSTASSTMLSCTGYLPSEDELLFIYGLFVFIFTVPFWERVFSLTKGLYDV